MPRLPDVSSFGARPTPRSERPIAGYDATIPARAAQRTAEGIAQAGAEVSALGEQMQAAKDRITAQREAVERGRAYGILGEEGAAELRRLETEEDLSSLDVTTKYGKWLAERQQKLVEGYQGSEAGRLQLTERLDAIRFKLVGQAATLGAQAQRKQIGDLLGKDLNALAAEASENPASMTELFSKWDVIVDDMAPALSPEEERAFRAKGRSQMAVSSLENLLDRGATGEAVRLLNETPGIGEIIDPETARRLRSRITVQQAGEEKARKAGEAKLREVEQILGRPATPDERMRLAGVAPKDGRQTLSDKVAEFEAVMRRPATPEEVSKMAGAATADDRPFGAGITGRSLEIMTDNAEAFAAGLLSEAEERRFISAATQYTQPAAMLNPDTGVMETRRNELPAFVREALEAKGVDIKSGIPDMRPGAEQGQLPEAQDRTGAGGADTAAPEASGGGARDQTIWGLADLATGPIPALAEAAGRTPVVGSLFPSPQMTQARNFIPIVQRELVRVLQNNPRYAEGERQAIEQDISISPSIYDTPGAFRNRLIAIDQALEVREQDAFETARSPNVGREERVQAMNVLNGIMKFRQNLGIPPRVKGAADWGALPAGAQYIDPEGNVRTKGGE